MFHYCGLIMANHGICIFLIQRLNREKLTHNVIKYLDDKSKSTLEDILMDARLCLVLVTSELASRLDKTKVIVVELTLSWTPTNFETNYTDGQERGKARKIMRDRGLLADDASLTYIVAIIGDNDDYGQFLDDNMIALYVT